MARSRIKNDLTHRVEKRVMMCLAANRWLRRKVIRGWYHMVIFGAPKALVITAGEIILSEEQKENIQ